MAVCNFEFEIQHSLAVLGVAVHTTVLLLAVATSLYCLPAAALVTL
jgi:hypothetical protein